MTELTTEITTELTADDRWGVQQTLALYGHFVDNGEWELLATIVAADARLETQAGEFSGPPGVRSLEEQLATSLGGRLPSHHTLNTIVRPGEKPGTAVAWSRYVLVTYEATAAGGDYLDTLEKRGGTWVLTGRRVTERNRERPGGEYSTAGAETFATFEAFGTSGTER
ncbi:hypothetical protein HDC34_000725 [Pseudoclavibacter sp. JAI123]|uniref:nuclear transport factor 2 family protein n=1 Tax=Pseudoclavibacter sp. JAI123 TaxID=2723065 RepID=UPI0015CED92A|nr:nuclear transport factor 2 family protein [Pseudoclavibacter sp. JAI123]NYF12431.1 hypothetical protein [Pseudoclavibacter sp. JAI123]